MPQRHGLDDVTRTGLATTHHKQAGDVARQRVLIDREIVEALIEERQIGELPDRPDHCIDLAREFGAGFDRRAAAAALVSGHAAFGLRQFDADHLAILREDARRGRVLEEMNALGFDRVHLQFVGRNLAARPIEHQINLSP